MSILPCFVNGYLMPNVFHEFYFILNYKYPHVVQDKIWGKLPHVATQ